MSKQDRDLEIRRLEDEIDDRQLRLAELLEEKESEESLQYIKTHNITLADVTLSSQGDFACLEEFRRWMDRIGFRAKRWAEWNGRIHRTQHILSGYNKPTPARLCDLINANKDK